MKNNKVQLSTEENAKQNPQKGAVMGKRKAKRTTTNCELFSLYPSPDGTFWKWFRFNSQKNRGGKKDIAIIARKAGFIVNEPITNVLDARMYVETAIEKGLLQVPGSDPLGGMKNACNIKLRNFVIRMMDPEYYLSSEPPISFLRATLFLDISKTKYTLDVVKVSSIVSY